MAVLLIWGGSTLGQGEKSSRSSKRQRDPSADGTRQAFSTSCAGCHGLDGKGGERGPDIVTQLRIRELSDAQLLEILQKGVPKTSMPAFHYLGDSVLRSLVTYLRALQGNQSTTTLPGNAQRGRDLFFGKAGCSGCHMVGGQGGFFASDLTAYSQGQDPQTIRDAIVLPNRDLDPRNRTVVVTLPSGKLVEGIARNEDNFSLQLLTQDGAILLFNKSAVKSLSYRDQSPMPADYETRLSSAEVEDLVNFLNSLTKGLKKSAKEEQDDGQ